MTIQATALSVRLAGRPVLSDVDVATEPGRLVTIVGPNGAGKSTLLRVLAGLIRPSSGTVLIDRQDVHAMTSRARARIVAFVGQSVRLDYPFTVREVVSMGLYSRKGLMTATATDAHLGAVIEAARLGPLAGRIVTRLSGGEVQRVALARSLAQDARALLLDEPTANLDIGQAHHVERILRRRADEGGTVVAATHDLGLAGRLSDQIVMLHEGRVDASGTPPEVLTPDRIRRVYGLGARVERDEQGQWHVRLPPIAEESDP